MNFLIWHSLFSIFLIYFSLIILAYAILSSEIHKYEQFEKENFKTIVKIPYGILGCCTFQFCLLSPHKILFYLFIATPLYYLFIDEFPCNPITA